MPQHRYDNIRNLPLNNYGKGPFCKFKVPNDYNFCGVYVIFVDGSPKYVGECQNLSDRFSIVNLRLVIRLLYNFTSNYTRMGQLSHVGPFYLDVINSEIKMGVSYE